MRHTFFPLFKALSINQLHFTPLFVFTSSRYRIIFSFFAISFYFYGVKVNQIEGRVWRITLLTR